MPSKKLIVIGITGTKGKTSAANFIWSVLHAGGIKTGMLTSANIRIGEYEEENNFHMTMPGRLYVQKMLRKMVRAKCEVAIVETTSQGIAQFRHVGIRYDVAIFTNLTPEHIESHGSFEEYKRAKGRMFKALSRYPNKLFRGEEFLKTIVANLDSEYASYYLDFKSDKLVTYSIEARSDFQAEHVSVGKTGSDFRIKDSAYKINLPGLFNVYNALPAVVVGSILNIPKEYVQQGLTQIKSIAGRMDEVKNEKGFRVFVDYAHEPSGLQSVIEAGNTIKDSHGKTIVLVGCAGGGRDVERRPHMGRVAARYADMVVVSDDEPYDEDPALILEAIKKGALEAGKVENQNLFVIGDRLQGIRQALSLAREGDVVIFTGLGHHKVRMMKQGPMSWYEKDVIKNELAHLKKHA